MDENLERCPFFTLSENFPEWQLQGRGLVENEGYSDPVFDEDGVPFSPNPNLYKIWLRYHRLQKTAKVQSKDEEDKSDGQERRDGEGQGLSLPEEAQKIFPGFRFRPFTTGSGGDIVYEDGTASLIATGGCWVMDKNEELVSGPVPYLSSASFTLRNIMPLSDPAPGFNPFGLFEGGRMRNRCYSDCQNRDGVLLAIEDSGVELMDILDPPQSPSPNETGFNPIVISTPTKDNEVAVSVLLRQLEQDSIMEDNGIETSSIKRVRTATTTASSSIGSGWGLAASTEEIRGVSWTVLTRKEKWLRVGWAIAKGAGLLCLMYIFVCSLDLLSSGFRLIGGGASVETIKGRIKLNNPVIGLMVGVLTTVLVQSSSTSTSIIVSMVSANLISVQEAVPIVIGTNIGTSLTSTIVSLTQVGNRKQFRRAFAGATVHDMFNWLTAIVLLPLEALTGYLEKLTGAIMESTSNSTKVERIETLGKITKPVVNLIVQINKNGNCTDKGCSPLFHLETKCNSSPCYMFYQTSLSDTVVGTITLMFALLVLVLCLILVVKLLSSVLKGPTARILRNMLETEIPHVPWIKGYFSIFLGAFLTFLLQSSSVFTSSLTPLVGLGMLTVDTIYPLTLGSNIGTTSTALLAAMAVSGKEFHSAMQIALCHLFFNLTGVLLFYPIPCMRWPIPMAKVLGTTTARYRWFAVVYVLLLFIIIPMMFIGLSFGGPIPVISVTSLMLSITTVLIIINIVQKKRPNFLPKILRSWDWLPEWLRSLAPYDKQIAKLKCCHCCRTRRKLGIVVREPSIDSIGSFSTDGEPVILLKIASSSTIPKNPPNPSVTDESTREDLT